MKYWQRKGFHNFSIKIGTILMEENSDDASFVQYDFELRFYIKHPYKSLVSIQEKIPLSISHGWSVGTERTAPNGQKLGGIRKETYWNYTVRVNGRRDFFNYAIIFLADLVEQYQVEDFFKEIVEEKGEINLLINLFGRNNIGDVLNIEQMKILTHYNVVLGLEYFPNN